MSIHALLETEFSLKLLSYSVNIIVDIRSVQLLWHQLRVSVLVLKERLLQGLQDSNGNFTRQTDILQAFNQHSETRLEDLTEVDDCGALTIRCTPKLRPAISPDPKEQRWCRIRGNQDRRERYRRSRGRYRGDPEHLRHGDSGQEQEPLLAGAGPGLSTEHAPEWVQLQGALTADSPRCESSSAGTGSSDGRLSHAQSRGSLTHPCPPPPRVKPPRTWRLLRKSPDRPAPSLGLQEQGRSGETEGRGRGEKGG
ncbi:hypothetical protein WMY93_016527 [Mugilogobius chulae]|uniref:Uncharacterized protein n=1 Tax=Mugilogobius chulae TaxID=88201 RepID=A0AAW0NQI2_9GOBI